MAVDSKNMQQNAADNAIDRITDNHAAHYEPFGWHHWPQSPWFSYQFRRGLGETQEGGGAVSEVFQAASRIDPTSEESWHVEWKRIADRNFERAQTEELAGHIRTAMNCFMRAADYYRQAEFFLQPEDPRRLATFTKMEESSHGFLRHLNPAGEVINIPYENGATLPAYFVRAPFPIAKQPVLICMGGLDSIKDEMWFMQAHGCLQRGISVLMIDVLARAAHYVGKVWSIVQTPKCQSAIASTIWKHVRTLIAQKSQYVVQALVATMLHVRAAMSIVSLPAFLTALFLQLLTCGAMHLRTMAWQPISNGYLAVTA